MIDGEGGRRTGRRWQLWLSLALVAALLICSVPVVLAVTFLDRLPGVGLADAAASPSPTLARSPRPGDPKSVTQAWLREQVGELLDQQASALLRGDERGFLAVAAPGATAATQLKRQFRSLRAMQVAQWRPQIRTSPIRIDDGNGKVEWRVLVTYEHCFVVPHCATGPVVIGTRWVDGASGPRLVAVEPSASVQDGPRPWEVSDLVVAVGKRTLVATTRAYRSRLAGLLSDAEAAATVADRYAVDGTVPDRYRIFYAGASEWKRWYGGDRPEWTAGYAVPIGGDRYDVVINAKDLRSTGVEDLLRHEMTHASTLPGKGYRSAATWWLVEGLADQAASGGRPVSRYDGLEDVRRLVAGGWKGPLDGTEPAANTPDWEVSARYGVGYLAVRHLVDRFGEPPVLAFFKAVVHDRMSLAEASRQTFDEDWPALHDDCVSYIRSAAS